MKNTPNNIKGSTTNKNSVILLPPPIPKTFNVYVINYILPQDILNHKITKKEKSHQKQVTFFINLFKIIPYTNPWLQGPLSALTGGHCFPSEYLL